MICFNFRMTYQTPNRTLHCYINPVPITEQVSEWMNDYIPLSASLRSFPCFLILSFSEPLNGSPYGCLGLFGKLGSFFCTGPFGGLLILYDSLLLLVVICCLVTVKLCELCTFRRRTI